MGHALKWDNKGDTYRIVWLTRLPNDGGDTIAYKVDYENYQTAYDVFQSCVETGKLASYPDVMLALGWEVSLLEQYIEPVTSNAIIRECVS